MHKKFSERGFADYVYWQTQDKKTLRRIILNAEPITATNDKKPFGERRRVFYIKIVAKEIGRSFRNGV